MAYNTQSRKLNRTDRINPGEGEIKLAHTEKVCQETSAQWSYPSSETGG